MADELLENLIGSTIDEETAVAEAGAKIDPTAAVLSLTRDRRGARSDAAAADYLIEERSVLKKQERMLDLQIEHLVDTGLFERAHLGNRHWRERLQLGLQLFIALVATIVGMLALAMLYGALTSRQVIVEPFDAPPSLAQRGLTGKVLASGLIDQLTRLQLASRSSIEKRHLTGAWVNDIKVEVPETGVSIGEIDRFLKARFGHDVHIGGDLVETPDGGLALTVRGDGVLPKTFKGGANDLEKLNTQAAEYIYGAAEPSLYAIYLQNSGRTADSETFIQNAIATAPKADRPFLLDSWGNALATDGKLADALVLYRQTLKLKPDLWVAYNNEMNAEWALQREEDVWREGNTMTRLAGGRPGKAREIYFTNWDTVTWNVLAQRNETIADIDSNGGLGTGTGADAPGVADTDIRLHDLDDASLQLRSIVDDPNDPTVPAMRHFLAGRIAQEKGDFALGASEMEAFAVAYANPAVSVNYPGYECWVAPAEEAAGHTALADAAIAKGGNFVDCWRFKADIMDHRGDWASAQKQYAAAVALAPDLPAAYYSWGIALVRHGDLNGAAVKFAAANARGPHWADPLKAWGDVLAREGQWREAAKKYREAVKWAPAWSELIRAEKFAEHKA